MVIKETPQERREAGGELKLRQFKSFDEFMSWWDSLEVEEYHLKHPEAVARLMEHRFATP